MSLILSTKFFVANFQISLFRLVGKSHIVYTGVIIKHKDQIIKFTEQTTVHFGKATQEQIQAYIETGEPL